jgi:plastocyanin
MRIWIAAWLTGVLLVSSAGCGGPTQPPGSIKVTMNEFAFNPNTVQHKAGTVTLFLVNSGSLEHDMVVTDSTGKEIAKSSLVKAGQAAVLDVPNLTTGTYQFYCSVDDHKANGMTGTLNVT